MATLSETNEIMQTLTRKKTLWERTANYHWIFPVISISVILIVWELLVRTSIMDKRFFPAPTMIVGSLTQYIVSGDMWGDLSISLIRVLLGFLIGAVPGILLGLIMGLSPVICALIGPVVSVLYPLPKSAILPLIMLIFGMGDLSKVLFIGFSVFFIVLLNTIAGVTNISQIHLDVAKNFGASKKDFYLRIALPGALPMIFTGLKLALGMSLLLIVLAEYVGAKQGIGFMIWNAWQVFDVVGMYEGLIVIATLGFISSTLVDWLARLLIPWRPNGK